MMTKPSITELDKSVDSRYTLVAMVAKRARMIGLERNKAEQEGAAFEPDMEKPVSQAVDEIASGVVSYVRSEAVDKAREYEEEKIIAISKLEKEGHTAAEHTKKTEEDPKADEMPEETETQDLFGDEEEYDALDKALKLALGKEAEEKD
ncbi:MAG: DNA-directed RNA polymerase subunit omega [Clostridia bacterium]|nr:DNA-directed RNA polymerase subunit omega [Clostridia bacterium]